MARCRKYRKQTIKSKRAVRDWQGKNTRDAKGNLVMEVVPVEKTTTCHSQAKKFFRVKYSDLHPHRRNEAKYEDVVGFCAGCSVGMADPVSWNVGLVSWNVGLDDGYVTKLRGKVGSVEELADAPDEQQCKLERKARLMDGIKADFMRRMQQQNTSDITLDDWREIFNKAMEDFVILGVQDS